MIDRHHLLECILWPNGDGTYRKIINRAKRLDELGIYSDFKLTIPIDHSTHQTMHREFEKGTEYDRVGENCPMFGRTGEKNPMFGLKGNNHPASKNVGDKNPRYGQTEDRCPAWKGDKAKPSAIYIRAVKRYKRGEISEEELKIFRDLKQEYIRERRHNKCQH